jgi:hypothetical protein
MKNSENKTTRKEWNISFSIGDSNFKFNNVSLMVYGKTESEVKENLLKVFVDPKQVTVTSIELIK